MRGLAIAFGILVITGFGVGVTELSLAVGHQKAVELPASPAVSKSASPAPTPSPSPSPSASASPVASPSAPTATTNSFVHMRAGTSTASADLANLQGGTVVRLTGKPVGLWQPVSYGGLNGYIYVTYLTY